MRHRFNLALSLACLTCGLTLAQPPEADHLLAHSKQVLFEQGAPQALPEIQKALSLYRHAANTRGEAVALGYLGYAYRMLGDYPAALKYLQQSLSMKKALGDRQEQGKTLVNLGLVHWDQGEYKQAIRDNTEALTLARAIGDRQIEGASLNSLGMCYDELGDFRRSLSEYQQALAIHRASGFLRGETDALGNLGGRYLLLGRYRDALTYYQQALALDEKQSLKPSMNLDLGNIALCYAGLGRIPESLAAFDRALALARETGQKKEESDWHKGKGSTLLRSGKYDAALVEYGLAAQVYQQAGLQRELVEALQDLGNLHALLGDTASAETEFHRALDIAQKIGNPRGVTTSLMALGGIEWRRKRYTQAAALYQQALAHARQSDNQELVAECRVRIALVDLNLAHAGDATKAAQQALDTAQSTGARPLQAEALYALGEAQRSSGNLSTSIGYYSAGYKIAQALGDPDLSWRFGYAQGQALESLNRDDDAVRAYEKAAETIESVRSQLREDRFRAGYLEDKYQVYVSLVRLLLKLGRVRQAFQFSERLRAQNYATLLRGVAPRVHPEAERELRERIRQLQRSIAEENAKDPSERRAAKAQSYSADLVQAERAYQNLLDDFRAADPEYAAVRRVSTPSVEELQRTLPGNAALIEYVVADNSLAIFVMTNRRLEAKSVPAQDLESRVELLRSLVYREDSDEWQRPAGRLREALIDPVAQAGWLNGVTRLYIVPHGVLHYLPFAVLPAKGRYLIEDYTVTYLPAASALASPDSQKAAGALLAAAPALTKLPYAVEEAHAVAEFFSGKTEVLVGESATETSFKRDAGGYRILHLATHGNLNALNPLLSSLALQPDRVNDGRLEVHEILDLRLRARLVTLSACDTALGSGYFSAVPAGEEFVGLTRAFLFAGSPSVLATLWQVNDHSTLDFTRSFYRLLDAQGAPGALAEAQRRMIHSGGRYSHPYFWAPFVLVGRGT